MKKQIFAGALLAASVAFAPLAHADIVVGLIAPLTGPVAAYGDQVKNGAQAAVEAAGYEWRSVIDLDDLGLAPQ